MIFSNDIRWGNDLKQSYSTRRDLKPSSTNFFHLNSFRVPIRITTFTKVNWKGMYQPVSYRRIQSCSGKEVTCKTWGCEFHSQCVWDFFEVFRNFFCLVVVTYGVFPWWFEALKKLDILGSLIFLMLRNFCHRTIYLGCWTAKKFILEGGSPTKMKFPFALYLATASQETFSWWFSYFIWRVLNFSCLGSEGKEKGAS